MYAIVEIAGKQYKVENGLTVTADKIIGKEGDILSLDRVLLVKDGEKVQIGAPFIAGLKIKAEILSQGKGPKVRVSKFKAKVRYRRTTGHRHALTNLKILSIKEETKTKTVKKTAPKKVLTSVKK